MCFCVYELTVYCYFVFRCICCRFLFFCCRGLFLLQGKCDKKVVLHHMQQAAPWSFFTIMKCFCTTCEALYTIVRMAPQAAGFCRSGRIYLLLAQKYELLRSNSRLLGCERVMETRAEFHFSWVYTFSATLSPCGTEQTTIDTGCDTALPRNCVDHPADCNLFKTTTLLNLH